LLPGERGLLKSVDYSMDVSGHCDTPDSKLADVHDQVMRLFSRRLPVTNPANFHAVGFNRAMAVAHNVRSPVHVYCLWKGCRAYIPYPAN